MTMSAGLHMFQFCVLYIWSQHMLAMGFFINQSIFLDLVVKQGSEGSHWRRLSGPRVIPAWNNGLCSVLCPLFTVEGSIVWGLGEEITSEISQLPLSAPGACFYCKILPTERNQLTLSAPKY